MAGHEYNFVGRDPNPIYTPSLDSDDDLPHLSNLDINDRSYRLFSFRKEGRSWSNAQYSESTMPESDIRSRAKRVRKPKHSVENQMKTMSPPRKAAVEDLVQRIKRQDPLRHNWELVAIDNDKPELTKRTGEVLAFSVILARVAPAPPPVKPASQERRRSTYISPTQEVTVPNRRGSKVSTQKPVIGLNRQGKVVKLTQSTLKDDPFGSTDLFSPEGKPMDPLASTSSKSLGQSTFGSLAVLDEAFGAKPLKLPKDKAAKKPKKPKNEKNQDDFDLDALFGASSDPIGDLLGGPLDDKKQNYTHDQDYHSSDFDSTLEIEPNDHDPKPRGRKRNDSGFASKTPIRAPPEAKSKPQPRRLSVKESKYTPRPVDLAPKEAPKYSMRSPDPVIPGAFPTRPILAEVTTAANGRRRQQLYHSSTISAETAPSTQSYSDHSVIEAEYEDYSSSDLSEDHNLGHDLDLEHDGYHEPVFNPLHDWRDPYANSDSRYERATRDHRRGPPSPQQQQQQYRYDPEPDPIPYTTQPSTSRRSRADRPPSDGAIQRYYNPTPTQSSNPISPRASRTPRPTLVTHSSATANTNPNNPRYSLTQSQMQSPLYPSNTPTTLVYPSDLRARNAKRYMTDQRERDKDQEIERLQWERDMALSERDLARREAEMHLEAARRASVVGVGGGRVSGAMGGVGRRDGDGLGIAGGIGLAGERGTELEEDERVTISMGDGGGERRRRGDTMGSASGNISAAGGKRYTHEPRLSRRYTDAYVYPYHE